MRWWLMCATPGSREVSHIPRFSQINLTLSHFSVIFFSDKPISRTRWQVNCIVRIETKDVRLLCTDIISHFSSPSRLIQSWVVRTLHSDNCTYESIVYPIVTVNRSVAKIGSSALIDKSRETAYSGDQSSPIIGTNQGIGWPYQCGYLWFAFLSISWDAVSVWFVTSR